jgi:hypothetical protein
VVFGHFRDNEEKKKKIEALKPNRTGFGF